MVIGLPSAGRRIPLASNLVMPMRPWSIVDALFQRTSASRTGRLGAAAALAVALASPAAHAAGQDGAAAKASGAAVSAAAPAKARKPMIIPPSSIIVVVRRAYVFGNGNERYCSPEISVFNQANKAISIVMIAAEYTQTRNGVARKVGNTHTRFSVDPGETISTGFYHLAADSCDNITAKASVSVCLWRDRSECHDRVVFSDSGQIPLFDAKSVDE
jgi:hypothetical protein